MDAVQINSRLNIPLAELRFSYTRSPGPGGQNVNKLNTRAELRFDPAHSPSLNPGQRERLLASLRQRLTRDGILVINSSRFRTQHRNRQDCLEKFAELLAIPLRPPPPNRRPKRPSRTAVERRLNRKKQHAQKKSLRRRPRPD